MQQLHRHQLTAEQDLLARIMDRNPGREIRIPVGPRWGHVINPAPDERPPRTGGGLRVLAICSWTLGLLAFETLKHMAAVHPEEVELVGLVTDDPLDTGAKISLKKRFWRYYEEGQREEFELGIVESALTSSVPCYTGEVKNDYFRDILARWDPEVIIVSAFGQAIDKPIIDQPALGIYNVHPSDLLNNYGAGPQPWEDLVARKATSTRVTLHHVSEIIDDGVVVGQSPPVNVALADGSTSDDVRMVGEKTLVAVPYLVGELMSRLVRRKRAGHSGWIDDIDFGTVFPDDLKAELASPLDPAKRGRILPLPPEEMKYTV